MADLSGRWMVAPSPSLTCERCGLRADHLLHVTWGESDAGGRLACPACAVFLTGQTHLRVHAGSAGGPVVITFDLRNGTHDLPAGLL